MDVRPFALLGAGRLEAVRAILERALAAWAGEWGVPAPTVGVERAWEAAPHSAPWQCARLGMEGRGMWLAWPADLPVQLQKQMFRPDQRHGPQQAQPAPVASAAAGAALAALAGCLAQHALGSATVAIAAQAPDGMRAYASGAAAFEVRIGKLACHGLLNHAALHALQVAAVTPTLPALDLTNVLAPQPVQLQVAIGKAEVSLGSLLALETGDVVRLASLAAHPLAVRDEQGRVLFGGHLGIAGNKLALEVVPGNLIGVEV